jgi:hypothetical protein
MKLKVLMSEAEVNVFARISLKDAYITFKDNEGTNSLIVKIGDGNLTYSEKRNINYLLDRGSLDDVQEGDDVPMDVSLDFTWEYLTGAGGSGAVGTVEEFLKQTGAYSGNVSTDADACRPYAIDIELEYRPTPSTCGDKETIALADFRYEELSHDLSASMVSMSGRCNITVAGVTRAAQ